MQRPTKKFEDKWFGPFTVERKVGASTYKLKLPQSMSNVHPVFNEVLLKPAIDPVYDVQVKEPPPPPVVVDEHEEYEVEEIRDARLHRRKLQFLVKWVGYNEPTWQPAPDLLNVPERVKEFYEKHPMAAREIYLPPHQRRR